MSINTDNTDDRTLNLQDRTGRIAIATAWVEVRDCYLTLAVSDGMPFDMLVTDDKDQAITNHNKFVAMGQLVNQVAAQMKEEGKTIVVPPKGTLLN